MSATTTTKSKTKKTTSAAQFTANQANAQRSTGPETAAGKQAARKNALKHGLTGSGVVLAGEDEHEIARRVAALEQELAPNGGTMKILLIRQIAITSVRVE